MANKELNSGEYYLSSKNVGAFKKLVGKVTSVVFFVNDDVSSWNDSAKKEYLRLHEESLNIIAQKAEKMNVPLEFYVASDEITIKGDCCLEKAREFNDVLISALKVSSIEEYERLYINKYPCDEAPVMFVLNKQGRSFAYLASQEYPATDEVAVIFQDSCNNFRTHTVIHEMLHQFGATDYYYPEIVKEQALKYFPKSVMNTWDGTEIDSLSAYLVGWTDSLDKNAIAFLTATKGVTSSQIETARGKS